MLDLLYIYIYTRVKSEFSFFAPPSPSFYPFPIRSPRIMLQFSFHEHEIIGSFTIKVLWNLQQGGSMI